MASFQYRHPKIYDAGIRLTQRPKILKEFKRQVGKNNSVFDVAAGYGRMASYVDETNEYQGIDLNDISIIHARKLNLNVKKGNIFDKDSYKKCDVYILVDVVHHIEPDKLVNLFNLVFSSAKSKVVILEPSFVNLEAKYGFIGKYIDKILMKLDNDGINTITKWYTEEEYQELIDSRFSSKFGNDFSVRVQKINPYYIITYEKNRT